MKYRGVSYAVFMMFLCMSMASLRLLSVTGADMALILVTVVLLGVCYGAYRAYGRTRKRYVAFVGSEKGWLTAKYELRYLKLKWVRSTADLNGEKFTEVYCTEQENRRHKVLYDAVVQYIKHTNTH